MSVFSRVDDSSTDSHSTTEFERRRTSIKDVEDRQTATIGGGVTDVQDIRKDLDGFDAISIKRVTISDVTGEIDVVMRGTDAMMKDISELDILHCEDVEIHENRDGELQASVWEDSTVRVKG